MTDLQIILLVSFIVLLLASVITITILIKINDNKKKLEIKNVLNEHGKLKRVNDYYHYEFNNDFYEVIFFKVRNGYKLSFNSKIIWEVKSGVNSKLVNMKDYTNSDKIKLVIIYPNPGPYVYYEDENNLKFTNPNKPFWNLKVIPHNDLNDVLKDWKNK